MTEWSISNLTDADVSEVVDVIRRSKKEMTFERPPTVDELRTYTVDYSEFRPEGSWVVRSGGAAVAFAAVIVEQNRLTAGLDDAHLDLEVVPEERGKGLEQKLIGLASDYIRSRKVSKARTRCVQPDKWRMDTLTAEGFSEAYRVFFLVRGGTEHVPDVPVPEGITLVRKLYKDCSDQELIKIVEAFNDGFQDHFGFAPETPEVFIKYRDATEDPECFSLAMAADEIVGVCLSAEDLVYNSEHGTKWGWINVLGVRPPYRRRGIGRFLLSDGMRWVLERGMDTTYIGVYAKNEKALGMYTAVGFKKDRESLWMEKSVG